jgi:hypothetical protein
MTENNQLACLLRESYGANAYCTDKLRVECRWHIQQANAGRYYVSCFVEGRCLCWVVRWRHAKQIYVFIRKSRLE